MNPRGIKWAVPILALVLLGGAFMLYAPLTNRAEAAAKQELTDLLDAAFASIETEQGDAAPETAAAEENLISKARAVSRYLAHDDALLETNGLITLCELLTLDAIDVTDVTGAVIASSDETRVSLAAAEDEKTAWITDVLKDGEKRVSKADGATLYACVVRGDAGGVVLIRRDDPSVLSALQGTSPTSVTERFYTAGDLLFEGNGAGEDGWFYAENNLCVRETRNGLTLMAARPISEVFAARNAAAVGFAVAVLMALICALVSFLLRTNGGILRVEADDDAAASPATNEEIAALAAPDEEETFGEEPAEEAFETEPEPEPEPVPAKPRKKRGRKAAGSESEPDDESGFDKIVE